MMTERPGDDEDHDYREAEALAEAGWLNPTEAVDVVDLLNEAITLVEVGDGSTTSPCWQDFMRRVVEGGWYAGQLDDDERRRILSGTSS